MSSETLLETAATTSPKATDIFHCETLASKPVLPGVKRKFPESERDREREREREGGRAKISCSQGSLTSPPLFKPRPNLAMVPGYPHEAPQTNGGVGQEGGGASQEDEWKNIKVVRLQTPDSRQS